MPIAFVTKKPCLADYVGQQKKVVSYSGYGHCDQLIETHYAGGDLLIFLMEDLPLHAGRSVVTQIALNYPNDASPINDIERRSGRASFTDKHVPWQVAEWCYDFHCTSFKDVGEEAAGTYLHVNRGSGFTLYAARSQRRMEEALRTALAARHIQRIP